MTTGSVIIIIKLSASYFTFHRVSMFHVREELWSGGRAEMKRRESHGNTFPKFRPQDPSLRDEFNDG